MPIREDFHVEVCDWHDPTERRALLGIREAVFVLEQHVPRAMEIDADDSRSVHVLARAGDDTPIGTGRLAPGGRIGRMAVLTDWRGRGVGTLLLEALVRAARTRGLPQVSLHAQRRATPFYRHHDFEVEGSEFEEAGIPHVVMRRSLDPVPVPRAPAPAHLAQLRAASREELIAVTRQLLSGARHSACFRVRELHPLLLNDTASMVELRRLAVSGRGASIRVIVEDLTRALQEGSRLLELAQRLPSVIQLRRPLEPADLNVSSAFLCVDTQGYLFRPLADEMTARGSTYAPGRHAALMQAFEDTWNRSEPWPELRELGI